MEQLLKDQRSWFFFSASAWVKPGRITNSHINHNSTTLTLITDASSGTPESGSAVLEDLNVPCYKAQAGSTVRKKSDISAQIKDDKIWSQSAQLQLCPHNATQTLGSSGGFNFCRDTSSMQRDTLAEGDEGGRVLGA